MLSRRRGPADGQAPSGRQWARADLLTGAGLADAVAGAGTVVHCATSGRRRKDVAGTAALVQAVRAAGCQHLVYVSIVGVDRVPLPYYQGKLAAERLIERSGVPATILRATQFHDLLRALFDVATRLPVLLAPGLRFQPVDVREVATRLVDLALAEPAGRAPDLGGPEIRQATDLARAYLAAAGRRRPVAAVRLPGATFRAFRQGGHLAPDHRTGRVTFEQYLTGLADRAGRSRGGGPA